jgi:hypothetical protein
MKRVVVVLIIAVGLLSGCAHRQALDRASTLEQQGNYRAALDQCELAQRVDPESKEAADCVARVRPHAINTAMADARAAFDAGDFPKAVEYLDYVDRTSPRRVDESLALRDKIDRILRARLDEALEAEKYGLALDTLDVMAAVEPERAAALERRKDRVRATWADALVERARVHEKKGQKGAALVLFLGADHIREHAVARTQAERLAGTLRDDALFQVHWDFEGSKTRIDAIERGFGSELAKLSNTRRADSKAGADLKLDAELRRSDCDTTRVSQDVAQQEYVAGTVVVDNPTYATLEQRLDEIRVDLREARERVDRRQAKYDERKEDLEYHRTQVVQPLAQELYNVEQLVQMLESNVQMAQQRLTEAEEQLARLQAEQASDAAITAQQDTVDKREDELQAEQQKLDNAQERHEELSERHDAAAATDGDLETKLDTAETRLQDAIDAVEAGITKKKQLAARLQRTPKTVEKDVIDTFEYKVATYERRCEAVLFVEGDNGISTALEHDEVVQDETHRAFPRYGVKKDPLELSDVDDQLWDKIDARLVEGLVAIARQQRTVDLDTRLDRARSTMLDKPHTATDLWLAVFLTEPQHLTKSDAEALAEHLQRHYGASPLKTLSEM